MTGDETAQFDSIYRKLDEILLELKKVRQGERRESERDAAHHWACSNCRGLNVGSFCVFCQQLKSP